jgi:hypothetical protein
MKWFIYSIFMVLYAFITFFGYGPALFADGSTQEKIITLGVVTLIEIILSIIFIRWILKNKMNKWLMMPPFVFIFAVIMFFI